MKYEGIIFRMKEQCHENSQKLNPIQDGDFRSCSRISRRGQKKQPLPKICHTYSTRMKLGTATPYLKKIQEIYESHDTPPELW